MSLHSIRLLLATAFLSVLVSGCGGGGSSASPPSGGITVTPGNGQATVSWNADPSVQYWLVYAPSSSISANGSTFPAGHQWAINITSPYVVTGLTNGTTYSFAMNGRTGGGSGGPSTPSVSAVPRPAGGYWTAGAAMSQDMHGIAYGTASDTTVDYVAVGSAGALYKGLDGINWTAVGGQTANFNAALYAFSKFIAVDDAGIFYQSTDLSTWTPGANNAGASMNALASNGTLAVAVGNGGKIYTSVDAVNWNPATSSPVSSPVTGGTPNLYGVAYSPSGLWVAVGATGAIFTSPDGNIWTDRSVGGSTLRGVAVQLAGTNYTYVAVGLANAGWKSSDGSTWVSLAGNGLTGDFYAINASSNQFLAVGAGGIAFASPDGSAWSQTSASGGGIGTVSTAASGGQSLYALYGSSTQYFAAGAAGTNISSK